MDAVGGGGEVVDAEPGDEEDAKRKGEDPEGGEFAASAMDAEVDVGEVHDPGEEGPGFFGIPGPVMTPGFFAPKGAEQEAEGEEAEAEGDEPVGEGEFAGHGAVKGVAEESFDRDDRGGGEDGIGEEVDHDMGDEPGALKGGHEVAVVVFRMEEVDEEEGGGDEGGVVDHPGVAPPQVDGIADGGKEEPVPEAGFAEGAHGGAAHGEPEGGEKGGHEEESGEEEEMGDAAGEAASGGEAEEEAGEQPADDGGEGEGGGIKRGHGRLHSRRKAGRCGA